MIFKETGFKGVFIIDIEKRQDDRGFFARVWCKNEFGEHGLSTSPVQANIAYSKNAGTLRGLHYQRAPYEESKLIQCIKGGIFDVIVDLRQEAPTYGKWMGVSLSEGDYKMLYVPEGFAHGYQTLVDGSVVMYQVSQLYSPEYECGIRYDDPAFEIRWPIIDNLIISEKDKSFSDYAAGR